MKASILFEPRDLWVGVYWTRVAPLIRWDGNSDRVLERRPAELWIYICLIPCFPILLKFRRSR